MILVVGASGLLGGMITRQLLEQGETVRVLQRNNPVYETLIEMGAEAVRGDLKDRASLDSACKGVKIVITTANAAQRGGEDTFESVDQRGTINLVDAAKSAGVQQFIYVSAYMTDLNSPVPLMRYKAECEQYLRASGLTYTILKPHIITEVWVGAVVGIPLKAGQPVTLAESGSKRHSFVSVRDVAAITVACVGNTMAYNEAFNIGGSRAQSWTQITENVARVLGRPLSVRYVHSGEAIPLLPEAMSQLLYSFEAYESDIDMTAVCQVLGVSMTPLEESLQHIFGGVSG